MIHLFHVVAGGLLLAVAGVATATDDWAQQDQQATAAYRVGDYVAARDHALQALAIAERDHADGPGAARLASSLNALALVLQASGDDDGARPLLERAVTVAVQALGEDHPNTVALRTNLAALRQAGEQRNRQQHAQAVEALNEQALAHHGRGEFAQAAVLYQSALPKVQAMFGDDSAEAGRVIVSLADTHAERKQYPEAEALYQRAVTLYEGREDQAMALAAALNAWAAVHYAQRQYGEAAPLFHRALEILEAARGETHPDLLLVLDNLTALYLTTGRGVRADEYRRRARAIREAGRASQ